MVIHFEGEQVTSDFSDEKAQFDLNYTAFYADCDHEVKPLKSGYRICLVYNLVQDAMEEKVSLLPMEKYVHNVARLIQNQTNQLAQKPFIFLLEHQYTPENFKYDALKLNDRYKAEVLLRAAKETGCYAKLCLVTSYLMGSPVDGGYFEYGEYGGDDDAKMDEVYESDLYIKYWDEGGVPKLGSVPFEEDDLITSFSKEEYEPIIKESTGYMGNYGPDLEHWYHFGAVMIWSKDVNAKLLKEAGLATQLKWIAWFNTQEIVSKEEEAVVRSILLSTDEDTMTDKDSAHYDAIADWIIAHRDTALFNELSEENLNTFFLNITTEERTNLFNFLGREQTVKIIERITAQSSTSTIEKLLSLLKAMIREKELESIAPKFVEKLPELLHNVYDQNNRLLNTKGLADLLWIESHTHPSVKWIQELYKVLTLRKNRTYVHNIWAPFLLDLDKHALLSKQLFDYWRNYIKNRTNNKPEPPKDWSRKVLGTKEEYPEWNYFSRWSTEDDKDVWNMLKDFLASPVENVFDFKRNEAERKKVERAINNAIVDLRMETIKKVRHIHCGL